MPEFREDATDDGFHEIQLSRKQLVFLFMTGSVALILVFLFGVVVGRDTATKPVEPADCYCGGAGARGSGSHAHGSRLTPRAEDPATPAHCRPRVEVPQSYPGELGKAKPSRARSR